MSTLAWVIGSGGLLGSHVTRALRRAPRFTAWQPPGGALPWGEPQALDARLGEAVRGFTEAASHHSSAALFWCAGAGVVGTSTAELAAESRTWERLLERLGAERAAKRHARQAGLSVFLASSAGGVYAGSPEGPVTETSPARALSAYGEAKLHQERVLVGWGSSRPEVSTLVARISNLYGPGQKEDKPQGLISQMSRCLIHDRPLHIYVPLDTIRDFAFVEDAAGVLVRWMERLGDEAMRAERGVHVLKICASERATTIAGLVGVFRRLVKRPLRIVSGLHPLSGQHPRRLQFRSEVWPNEPRPDATTLLSGIDRVIRHQRALHQAGALAPPESERRASTEGPMAPHPARSGAGSP